MMDSINRPAPLPPFRKDAPDTSRLAAESVANEAPNREKLALNLLGARGAYGATCDEIASAFDWERYSARPRVAHLHKTLGLVVDSGLRRKGVSGRNMAVWVLREFGPPAPADPQGDFLA